METWKSDGAKGVRTFVILVFVFRISNVLWLSTGGGPRQLFCKKFTFASQCCHIVDQNSEFRFSWRIVVARNTSGTKMVISVDNVYLRPRKGKLAAQCCAMISCN